MRPCVTEQLRLPAASRCELVTPDVPAHGRAEAAGTAGLTCCGVACTPPTPCFTPLPPSCRCSTGACSGRGAW